MLATMRSRARGDGNSYVLNGRKSWVTSGPVADYVLTFMLTRPELQHKGISAFLVDAKNSPGFSRGRKEPKLGIRASATSELLFENCRIPASHRFGQEGEGFKIAMTVLDAGRIGIASQALGIAEAAYGASVAYAREREAFGHKIGDFQGIGFKIADMKTRIEASRLLIHAAAMAKERSKTTGARYTMEVIHGKAVCVRDCDVLRARRRPDPWRDGLQPGSARGALLPRREDHRDLRGHQRDPKVGHFPTRTHVGRAGVAVGDTPFPGATAQCHQPAILQV